MADIPHTVCPANVPEIRRPEEPPRDFAIRLAREKAREVWHKLGEAEADSGQRFVLGADTIVLVDDLALGKPENAEDAARMLRLLSGRSHEVLTAVCLVGAQRRGGDRSGWEDFEDSRAEITRVEFNVLTEEEIRSYIAHGEPMDKAGAYAIQGIASRWISRVEGDYSNVVGLPVRLVYRMLHEHKAI